MKITEIKTTIIEGSYPWVYVRVATDEGLYGLAEAYPIRGVIDVLHRQLEELLIGQDPLAIEPLYNHLLERTPGQSSGGTTLAAETSAMCFRTRNSKRPQTGPLPKPPKRTNPRRKRPSKQSAHFTPMFNAKCSASS